MGSWLWFAVGVKVVTTIVLGLFWVALVDRFKGGSAGYGTAEKVVDLGVYCLVVAAVWLRY